MYNSEIRNYEKGIKRKRRGPGGADIIGDRGEKRRFVPFSYRKRKLDPFTSWA